MKSFSLELSYFRNLRASFLCSQIVKKFCDSLQEYQYCTKIFKALMKQSREAQFWDCNILIICTHLYLSKHRTLRLNALMFILYSSLKVWWTYSKQNKNEVHIFSNSANECCATEREFGGFFSYILRTKVTSCVSGENRDVQCSVSSLCRE